MVGLHIHKYSVIRDTGKTKYLECRLCGNRKIEQVVGGYQPVDSKWLTEVNNV